MKPRLGWRPDPAKLPGEKPDRPAGPLLRAAPPPPPRASNRHLVVSILDQGPLSSCVANAIMQAVRASHVAQGVKDPKLGSRLFGYYLSRAYHHDTGEDAGTYLRTFCQGLNQFGFCPEDKWPYDPAMHSRMPPAAAFRAAHDQAAPPPTDYRRIVAADGARIDEIKRAIAAGFLVCFGTPVSEAFAYGELPRAPLLPPIGEPLAGGHAICIVGYDGDTFDIVNSWSNAWGESGYCRFSAAYLMWAESTDFWIINQAPRYSE